MKNIEEIVPRYTKYPIGLHLLSHKNNVGKHVLILRKKVEEVLIKNDGKGPGKSFKQGRIVRKGNVKYRMQTKSEFPTFFITQ